ncbi:MAG: methionine--tRNA ligase [Candidatus Pacebacteria bacterium]|nr:methionine--tRNA ligase [Candidatus Paceibacterota bacterium]
MSENKKSFYITTTLPYVNSKPHVGFAMEIVRADALARFKREMGFDVFFNTGTDEHGVKIFEKATENGKTAQGYVDEMSEHFKKMKTVLNLSYDNFIRTTDANHILSAQKFWQKCLDAGFIYKKEYSGLYCVGDEMFVKEKDLVEGKCPNHPLQNPVILTEENYFFALSKFSDQLSKLFNDNPDFVVPNFRLNEMKQMIESGLEDFSISRIKEKMPWGISIPNDDTQVMYVWFDALVNYISAVGWPDDEEKFNKYWNEATRIQFCGKDNTQHQAVRWQAMLMAAGIKNTNQIIVNGFINSGGQKMSKSLGNVVDPIDIVEEYGIDMLRYYLLREISPFEDSDITPEKIKSSYNANLANGLGNLLNRILKMSEDHLEGNFNFDKTFENLPKEYTDAFDNFNFQAVMDFIWKEISELDQIIQDKQPFKLIKENQEEAKKIIFELVEKLFKIGILLKPLLPETSDAIISAIHENKKPEQPLFLRKD